MAAGTINGSLAWNGRCLVKRHSRDTGGGAEDLVSSRSKRDIVARAQVLESLKPRRETSAMGCEPEGGSEEGQKQE